VAELRFLKDHPERELLAAFRDLLGANREAAGLTSISDPDEIDRRHIGESLLLLDALEAAGVFASPAIDVGAGGGLPGIPIKIVRPDLELTLLEATTKKASFLGFAIDQLGLDGVSVVNARAEDASRDPAHREAYELALARAVAPLPVLVELTLPFLRIGGTLATPKGSRAQEEVRTSEHALSEGGGEVMDVSRLELPWGGDAPTLVIVRKVAPTPSKYPRRPGLPGKRPL
jgi:16S rRNA (guanine527-N7)-methyltransferase